MTPEILLAHVIRPALTLLREVSGRVAMHSTEAEVLTLAIALQETNGKARWQAGRGPAKGYWQFERSGLRGVLEHAASGRLAIDYLRTIDLSADPEAVWAALPYSELAQAGLARLLLWTDPLPLPSVADQEAGWGYYLRNWRPGKPHAHHWAGNWAQAREMVRVGLLEVPA